MKIVTLSKVGYNHPSQANWSYGVWKIDLIDTKQSYCMSYTVKETFGGDYRLRERVNLATGKELIETKGVRGLPKITGVRGLFDIESEEILKAITEFLTK